MCSEVQYEIAVFLVTLHKKWSFPLRISSVNVSESAFFVQCYPANETLLVTRHNEKLKISYTNTVIMVIKTYTHFFISNTLVSNTRMTLAKNSSNTLRLSTCYLKNICILHPCYHPTIMKYSKVSKKGLKKQSVSAFVRLCD